MINNPGELASFIVFLPRRVQKFYSLIQRKDKENVSIYQQM